MKTILWIPLAFIAVSASCAGKSIDHGGKYRSGGSPPVVRVKLLDTRENIVIRSEEPFLIRVLLKRMAPPIYYSSKEAHFMPYGSGITMIDETGGSMEIGLKRVSIHPGETGNHLAVNGRPFRGALEIIYIPKTVGYPGSPTVMVLNLIRVEDYLKGVVPAEIGRRSEDEIEAVKAQTVAARTYALSKLGQYRDWGYDLESTVEDQVYRGVEGEDPLVNGAIEETEGIVLTWGGVAIDAYYHSNCGGMTESIERVWEKSPQPYLIPAVDEHCSWAKSYRWEETWSRNDLEENLSAFLDTLVIFPEGGLGELTDLVILQRSPSGRVERLEVITATGRYGIDRDRIRWALRRGDDKNRILPGTLFDLEIERGDDGSIDRVTASGQGNGHGVGMCQTGAIGRARKGFSFDEILIHYYPGTELGVWR